MSETLTELDNLYKTITASVRIVLRLHSRGRAASGFRTQKLCGNKTSNGCVTRGNFTVHFRQGSAGTRA